jgi:hypothetical protein
MNRFYLVWKMPGEILPRNMMLCKPPGTNLTALESCNKFIEKFHGKSLLNVENIYQRCRTISSTQGSPHYLRAFVGLFLTLNLD